jgi:hypothetical protein
MSLLRVARERGAKGPKPPARAEPLHSAPYSGVVTKVKLATALVRPDQGKSPLCLTKARRHGRQWLRRGLNNKVDNTGFFWPRGELTGPTGTIGLRSSAETPYSSRQTIRMARLGVLRFQQFAVCPRGTRGRSRSHRTRLLGGAAALARRDAAPLRPEISRQDLVS